MGWKRLGVILLVAMALVTSLTVLRERLVHRKQAPTAGQTGAVLSPDGGRGVRIVQESGVTRVWLESYADHSRKLLADLGMQESASNPQWSPNGRLVAFETFDSAGHSPMTTNHVWVVNGTSGEIRKLRLPPPNERFSTYLEGWTDADTVRVRTTLLDRAEDAYFVYSFATDQVHPAG